MRTRASENAVKLDKLAKKLKKELARNAKKSAALGVCCLVAIWFWAPLIAKWTGMGKPAVPAAPASATAVASPGQPAGATVAPAAKATSLSWNDIVELMRRDPRSLTANVEFQRDPFAQKARPAAGQGEQTTEVEHVRGGESEVTPQSAGLVLSSTLVSRNGGVANIGGRAYSVGEMVALAEKEDAVELNLSESEKRPAVEFKLLEIHVNRVVLQREGKSYELTMKETPLPRGNRIIVRSGTAENK